MTYFTTTIRDFLFGRPTAVDSDPVYRFFFETSSGDRKKVYNKALKKAQAEQDKVTQIAKEKTRA